MTILNGCGTIKREITTWNTFKLTSCVDKYMNRIHIEIFIEIRNIINDAQATSKYCSK